MARRELTLPNKIYYPILATWCSIVLGVVIVYGGNLLPGAKSQWSTVSDSEVAICRSEAETWREESIKLADAMHELDPDNPALKNYVIFADTH